MSRSVELLDGAVRIRYGALDRAATLVGELVVPYDDVEAVEVGLDGAPSPWTPLRVGLAEPVTGRRRGRFWRSGKRWFLDLRDPRRALVLRLRRGGRFDVVALEHADAEHLAEAIRSRIGRTRA